MLLQQFRNLVKYAVIVLPAYNHFEVELIDDFDDLTPPPAIALCTASPFDPCPKTNFKQDFIRFWATGEGNQSDVVIMYCTDLFLCILTKCRGMI